MHLHLYSVLQCFCIIQSFKLHYIAEMAMSREGPRCILHSMVTHTHRMQAGRLNVSISESMIVTSSLRRMLMPLLRENESTKTSFSLNVKGSYNKRQAKRSEVWPTKESAACVKRSQFLHHLVSGVVILSVSIVFGAGLN